MSAMTPQTAGARPRISQVVRLILVLGTAAWAVCGAFALCMAGLLPHACSQDEFDACGHEGMCAEDPCSVDYVRPDCATAPLPVVVALAATFWVIPPPLPTTSAPAALIAPSPLGRSPDVRPLRL